MSSSQKNHWDGKNPKKTSKCMTILAIRSLTRSLQSNGKGGFQTWPDRKADIHQITSIVTYRLNRPRGQARKDQLGATASYPGCLYPLRELLAVKLAICRLGENQIYIECLFSSLRPDSWLGYPSTLVMKSTLRNSGEKVKF